MEKRRTTNRKTIKFMKKIRYFLEYLLVRFWIFLMKLLSLKQASDFGSKFFQLIGMKLKVSKTAYKNIKMIFPDISDKEANKIVSGVWDNFGRMAAETPIFLDMQQKEFDQHVNITGLENIAHLKNKKALFFTAHVANWEIPSKALMPYGIRFHVVYRAANNKLVDKIINDLRNKVDIQMIPKGKSGAKQIISALQNNSHIVMLLDQKMNDGIKIPFMGKDAMTAPAIASLALKYDCPIIPVQTIRKNKYHFEIIIDPPLEYEHPNVESIMLQVNNKIGSWVKENPEQWFWLHKRWIDS